MERHVRTPLIRALFVAAFVVVATGALAQNSVGLILGEPSGISGKQWLNADQAVDVALAWSFIDYDQDG